MIEEPTVKLLLVRDDVVVEVEDENKPEDRTGMLCLSGRRNSLT